MGSGVSTTHTHDVLQSFGTLSLLTTLNEGITRENFAMIEDPTITSLLPLFQLLPADVYPYTQPLSDLALTSNPATSGVSTYILYVIELLLAESDTVDEQSEQRNLFLAFNVFHARILMQSLIEKYSSNDIESHLTVKSANANDTEDKGEIQIAFPLIHAVTRYLINRSRNLNSTNIETYIQVLALLLVLFGTQLSPKEDDSRKSTLPQLQSLSTSPSTKDLFISMLMMPNSEQNLRYGLEIDAEALLSVLFDHIVARRRFDASNQTSSTKRSNSDRDGRSSTSNTNNDYVSGGSGDGSTIASPSGNIDLEGGMTGQTGLAEAAAEGEDESAWSAFVEIGRFFVFPFTEIARLLMTGEGSGPSASSSGSRLADLSIFPLLILLNYHCPSSSISTESSVGGRIDEVRGAVQSGEIASKDSNPFKRLISRLNPDGTLSPDELRVSDRNELGEEEKSATTSLSSRIKYPTFQKIYSLLLDRIGEDSTILMLYDMLQMSNQFRIFLSSKSDLDLLLLPLLSTLYRAHESTRLRVYTILIILTVMSYDEQFIQSASSIVINTPSWFKEKYLASIPLPELIALVLLRTIHLNIRGMRDSYLYDNCLACIGNLAPQLANVSFYTSKKLIFTTNLFIQRYEALMKKNEIVSSRMVTADEEDAYDSNDDYSSDEYDSDGELIQIQKPSPTLPHSTSNTRKSNSMQHLSTINQEVSQKEGMSTRNNANQGGPASGSPDPAPSAPAPSIPVPTSNDIGSHTVIAMPSAGSYEESHSSGAGVVGTSLDSGYQQISGMELLRILEETEGYIQTMLDVIDCLFRRKPTLNIQLIYALILEPELFVVLDTHPRMGRMVNHLNSSTETFLRQVQSSECHTPQEVVQQISSTAKLWRTLGTPHDVEFPLPDLRFQFQETNASLFFTPSIWKIALKSPFIYWRPEAITIFNEGAIDPSFSGDDAPDSPPRSIVPDHL